MTKEVYLDITLRREPAHKEIRKTFQQNTGLILIRIYDDKAKKIRMKASGKESGNKTRHFGDQVIMKEEKISSGSVKEIIREIDAVDEEDECDEKNFKERADLLDKEARLSMRKNDSISDKDMPWI